MTITDLRVIEKLRIIKKSGKTAQERVRAHAILLSNDGKKSQEIADIFEVTQRTVFHWFKDYKVDGISSLKCSDGRGRKRLLNKDEHLEVIKGYIEEYPHQPKKAYVMTMEKLEIKMSYMTFKRFLKKNLI